ncbi:hypothetical protein PW52_04960 [Tamlana sedimentorum]|uniref:Uncharacterized protein n=1 Tax=Neotamlana sedimentorum TaxID=1435349 RepID=A0A0D7WBB2_9FLAO|nr:hypothetical protein [Tamlana sedimentorum]KJD35978.1 hypothetical protein PW52_04960 [Tamlana sedimentorum]
MHNDIIVLQPNGGNAHGERPIIRSEDGHSIVLKTDMDFNLFYHPSNPDWMEVLFRKMRAVCKEPASVLINLMFAITAGVEFIFFKKKVQL